MKLSGRTKAIQDVICCQCGHVGFLTLKRTTDYQLWYYYVGHYKDKNGKLVRRIPMHRMNKKYAYCCYIGKYAILSGYRFDYPAYTAMALTSKMGEHVHG